MGVLTDPSTIVSEKVRPLSKKELMDLSTVQKGLENWEYSKMRGKINSREFPEKTNPSA